MNNPVHPEKPGKKPMRAEMPTIAAWVDAMVAAFGKDEVHGQIRRGMAGEPTFYAQENGHAIGTRPARGQHAVRWNAREEARIEPIDRFPKADAAAAGPRTEEPRHRLQTQRVGDRPERRPILQGSGDGR